MHLDHHILLLLLLLLRKLTTVFKIVHIQFLGTFILPCSFSISLCLFGLLLMLLFSCYIMSNSVTLWTVAHQAPLWSTFSWNFLKFMFIEPVMLYNHLILWHPLLLLPSIFSSMRAFSNELALCIRWPKHLSFSFNGFHDSSVGEEST